MFARAVKGVRTGLAIARGRGLAGGGTIGTFLDVGSRGGLASRWQWAYRAGLIRPVFVEPDAAEAASLRRRYPGETVIEVALGARDATDVVLNITREPGRSSVLEPDVARLREYGCAGWEVVERRSIAVRRLEHVWERDWGRPTYAKIDVQGYELEVLEGLGRMTDDLACVELEVVITPLYVGQPAFGDVADRMHRLGFDLVKLASMGLFARRSMIEFNSFWVRRDRHGEPGVALWKSINDVPDERRAVVWGH